MKPEEIALLSLVISGVVTLIGNVTAMVVGKRLSKRVDTATAQSQEGEAARSLSESARIQLETYNKEVILPMKQEMEEIRAENRSLEMALNDEKSQNRKRVAMLEDEIANIKAEVRKADDALEFLIGATRLTHPQEVETAYKIRRGELHI